MKVKVSGLTLSALDYAVAMAAKVEVRICPGNVYPHLVRYVKPESGNYNYNPSTQWSQGGPIIAQAGITLSFFDDDDSPPWDAYMQMRPSIESIEGFDPLVLAMQMFVMSKFGTEIDIPEELL